MLSGQRAFRGETAMDAMTAIVKEDPPALPVAERHIAPALDRIVTRCLEKAPAARFQSTRDLAFALEGLSSHSETATAIPGRAARSQRERIVWMAAAMFLLAAGALGAMAYLTRASAPTAAPEMRLQIITPPEANLASFELSPDGHTLVFLARGQL